MKLLLLCVILCSVTLSGHGLRIGAFNIKVFGPTKSTNATIMNILADIVQRYDIILIQEIRDITGQAINRLRDKVNDVSVHEYDMEVSGRLGRSSTKEAYAFLYRKAYVSVIDQYQYSDTEDVFEREPFAVKFRVTKTAIEEFGIMALHSKPDTVKTKEELDALVGVYDRLRVQWESDNIVMMGDFNADCSYLSQARKDQLLLKEDRFLWLIDDDVDTTTKESTDCAYDRIIVAGSALQQDVVPGSGKVFLFHQTYSLNQKMTDAVSDHYPVEFELKDQATSVDDGVNGATLGDIPFGFWIIATAVACLVQLLMKNRQG